MNDEVKDFGKRLRPRRVIGKQAEKIRELLRDLPKMKVNLEYQSGDREALNFAVSIEMFALRDMGWTATSPPKPVGDTYGELVIRTRDKDNPAAGALAHAFVAVNAVDGASQEEDTTLPDDTITLTIGTQSRRGFIPKDRKKTDD